VDEEDELLVELDGAEDPEVDEDPVEVAVESLEVEVDGVEEDVPVGDEAADWESSMDWNRTPERSARV
jgi:hypothetical protein